MKRICNTSKNKLRNYILVGLSAFIFACNPQGAEVVEDLDLVATAYSKDYNFSAIRTYYMPGRVVSVTDPGSQQSNVLLDSNFHQVILSQVASNLASLGYTRIDTLIEGQEPDVVVQVAALSTTNTNLYYDNWWDYWGGYYGSFYPTYGYGWYPYPRLYSYSYQTGTVIIEMIDPNTPDMNQRQIPSLWVASLNGLLSGSDLNLQNRVISGIDQAFRQSPYLGSGG